MRVSIDGERVTVTGRRVSRRARGAWLAAQGVVMVVIVGLLANAVVVGGRGAWLWLAAAFAVLWIGSSLGALLIWWPADLGERGFVWLLAGRRKRQAEDVATRSYVSLELTRGAISHAARSRWYSRHGLWLVSWPWQLLALGPNRTVVFDGDDPGRQGHPLVFALMMDSEEAATDLAQALSADT